MIWHAFVYPASAKKIIFVFSELHIMGNLLFIVTIELRKIIWSVLVFQRLSVRQCMCILWYHQISRSFNNVILKLYTYFHRIRRLTAISLLYKPYLEVLWICIKDWIIFNVRFLDIYVLIKIQSFPLNKCSFRKKGVQLSSISWVMTFYY